MRCAQWIPAVALLFAMMVPAAPAAEMPRKASDFTVNLPDGKSLPLSQYKGKPVVLIFILTACPHCQNTVKVLSKLQTEYAARGLQVVASAIEQDAKAHIGLFVKNLAPTFPVGYNTGAEADTLIHPTGKMPMMPLLGFIDRQGYLRVQHEGEEPFFNDLEPNLRKEIQALLAPATPGRK